MDLVGFFGFGFAFGAEAEVEDSPVEVELEAVFLGGRPLGFLAGGSCPDAREAAASTSCEGRERCKLGSVREKMEDGGCQIWQG